MPYRGTAARYHSPVPLFFVGTTPLQRDSLQVSFPHSAVPYRYCPPRRGYQRYHSPTALLSTGAVPPAAPFPGSIIPPQRCCLQVLVPHGATSSRCHVLCCCSLQVLLSPAALFPPGTAALMVPFPPGTMFYSAVPSRYHTPAVLLPPGTTFSWSAPSSLHPNSTAVWIACLNTPFSYTGRPIAILFYSILFYSILFYSILFYSILFYSILFYSVLHIFSTWQCWDTSFVLSHPLTHPTLCLSPAAHAQLSSLEESLHVGSKRCSTACPHLSSSARASFGVQEFSGSFPARLPLARDFGRVKLCCG